MKTNFNTPEIIFSVFDNEKIITSSGSLTAVESVSAQLADKQKKLGITKIDGSVEFIGNY